MAPSISQMEIDKILHESAKSIFTEEGYNATVNFLCSRGYARYDAQNYTTRHFLKTIDMHDDSGSVDESPAYNSSVQGNAVDRLPRWSERVISWIRGI